MGVGAAGLTQFLVWTLTMGAVSGYGAAMGGDLRMPEMSPVLLGAFVGFFVLGYFLYGSLYAAVGAAVNTPQEAQALARLETVLNGSIADELAGVTARSTTANT